MIGASRTEQEPEHPGIRLCVDSATGAGDLPTIFIERCTGSDGTDSVFVDIILGDACDINVVSAKALEFLQVAHENVIKGRGISGQYSLNIRPWNQRRYKGIGEGGSQLVHVRNAYRVLNIKVGRD